MRGGQAVAVANDAGAEHSSLCEGCGVVPAGGGSGASLGVVRWARCGVVWCGVVWGGACGVVYVLWGDMVYVVSSVVRHWLGR